VRDEEDDYYDMVANASKAKKDDKTARYAAYAAASKSDRVVETEEIGEDGKRKITYAIQKNKGLAPRRSKDVRNPRVRRRKQFEAKQKKLKSMKPVWQGGEPKGGYRGELSGINATVIKSTKL
jgi:U3 small nucleolar RNA-associated protein 3